MGIAANLARCSLFCPAVGVGQPGDRSGIDDNWPNGRGEQNMRSAKPGLVAVIALLAQFAFPDASAVPLTLRYDGAAFDYFAGTHYQSGSNDGFSSYGIQGQTVDTPLIGSCSGVFGPCETNANVFGETSPGSNDSGLVVEFSMDFTGAGFYRFGPAGPADQGAITDAFIGVRSPDFRDTTQQFGLNEAAAIAASQFYFQHNEPFFGLALGLADVSAAPASLLLVELDGQGNVLSGAFEVYFDTSAFGSGVIASGTGRFNDDHSGAFVGSTVCPGEYVSWKPVSFQAPLVEAVACNTVTGPAPDRWSSTFSAVPAPGSLGLLILGVLCFWRKRSQ